MKKVLGLLASLAIALGLSSCGDDVTKWNTIEEEYQLPVITLKIGDEVQETEWNKAAKKNICKVDVTEKKVVNLSVKASKVVKEESIDITDEIKDSLKWYIGKTEVDAEKNGLTSFDFDTANKNKGSYTFYCSYTAKDANGTEWTYTSKAVEFKLLKPGINLEVSDDELEFGAKDNTVDVKTTLKVTPYEFEPTSYQVIKIIGNDEGDENIDVTDKDLENEGVEVTFNKAGTHRIKVIAGDGTKSATEEIEVHVKEITIENEEVNASFTVDKTNVYEGEAMPVVTPAAIKTITYSDGDEKKDNITVTKFELKVGTAEPQIVEDATGTVPLTEAGDLSIVVTKVWTAEDDCPTEGYVCQSDAKTITYIMAVGNAEYKATATVSAATVKETVDTTFTITSKLEKSQKYTNSETPVTVDVSNQISGIVVKLGDTTLTANADDSYNVSDLVSGENTLSITVNGEGSTSATTEVKVTYATIDKAKTEYVATITKSAATKGDTVNLAAICKLTQTLHWTNNDVKTDDVTPTAAKWYKGTSADAVTTEITSIDTSAAAEIYVKVVLTYDGKDTTSETVKFTISDAPSSWTAGQDIPSWIVSGVGTGTSSDRDAFKTTENGGTKFAQSVAIASGNSFVIKPHIAGTLVIAIACDNNTAGKGTGMSAKKGETAVGTTYSFPSRNDANATAYTLAVEAGATYTFTVGYNALLYKIYFK